MASGPTSSPTNDAVAPRPQWSRMESVHSTVSSTMHRTQLVSPTQQRPNAATRMRKRVIWAGRTAFFCLLFAAAAVMGFWAYFTLKGAENDLAERQFESMANRALNEAAASAQRQRLAALTAASLVSERFPEASTWPLFTVRGFERIVSDLVRTAAGRELVFAPLVRRRDQVAFETMAYDYYEQTESDAFDIAYSSFGEGIWAFNSTSPDEKYHDTEGEAQDILLPLFQGVGTHAPFMLNTYSLANFRPAIDSMLSCSEDRTVAPDIDRECGAITPVMRFRGQDQFGATMLYPVYPADARDQFAGYMTTLLLFEDVLENIFADGVNGIDCVFVVANRSLTYTIRDGIPELVSEDEDLHDSRYNDMGQSVRLTDPEYFTNETSMFTLHIYPSGDFEEFYGTNNPTVAVVGVVCIILGMTFVFAIYDFFVRREFTAKKELLEAKRQFMRFVSHEVRTPLNAVFMGLQLMKTELASCLVQDQSECLNGNTSSDNAWAEDCSDHAKASDGLDVTGVSSGEGDLSRLSMEWLLLTQEIQSNVQGAVDVLNDLLNYDKIEQSSLRLDVSLFNIQKIVENSYNEFNLSAKHKRLDYRLLYESAGKRNLRASMSPPRDKKQLRVLGDSVRISQVLRNLISNAVKFTPDDGCINLTVRWNPIPANSDVGSEVQELSLNGGVVIKAQAAGELQLSVEDSGAGMTQEQLAKLFSDGVQFNANQLQSGQGSGLGLYIAKGIVEQHGGSLTVQSRGLGQGTTFTMTLPLWTTRLGMCEEPQSISMEFEPMEGKPSFHILVVDDVKSNRKLLSRLLRNDGHTCEEAEDGDVAVRMLQEAIAAGNPYDAVVMDYEMPNMSGPDAAKEIRKLDSRVEITGVTGNVLPDDIAHFKACGANGVLPKPLKLSELRAEWYEHGLLS